MGNVPEEPGKLANVIKNHASIAKTNGNTIKYDPPIDGELVVNSRPIDEAVRTDDPRIRELADEIALRLRSGEDPKTIIKRMSIDKSTHTTNNIQFVNGVSWWEGEWVRYFAQWVATILLVIAGCLGVITIITLVDHNKPTDTYYER